MTIDQIKWSLNQVENLMFFDSLYGLDVEELKIQKVKVEKLIESFLWLSYKDLEIEELEHIRFQLLETSTNIEIRLKEELKEDTTAYVRKLESLYRTA
ncbi:hypothetical protein ACLM5H_05835 [Fredinandcohnia humi]